jgi:hypothetical protein
MRNSILLFVVLCTFSGCGSNNTSTQVAKLRLLLACCGGTDNLGSTVTVSINGKPAVFPQKTCPPNQACTLEYLTVPAGGFKFAVQGFGSMINMVPSQFQTLNLSPNTQNTFILVAPDRGYLFLDDSVPAAGSVKLRVANADADLNAPAAAWVNSDGSTTGNPTISGVELGSASSYATLPPGQYIVTCEPDSIVALYAPTTLAANQNVTVYLWDPNDFADIQIAFIQADN